MNEQIKMKTNFIYIFILILWIFKNVKLCNNVDPNDGYIDQLPFFDKDDFSIEYTTNVDMPLNKKFEKKFETNAILNIYSKKW